MDADKHTIIAHLSIDNAALRWGAEWPLPIGKQAVLLNHEDLGYDYYGSGYASLLNWVPFEGEEEALWALRVARGSASLDLFGLARRTGEGVHRRNAPMTAGELAFVLRGRDTSLLHLIDSAKRWWGRFRGLTFRGRPPGTGTWESREHFVGALRRAMAQTRSVGDRVTQETVAPRFPTSDRQLRAWLKQYGVSWPDIKGS